MSDTTTTKGYRTTEFWLSLAAKLLGILFASGAIGDGSAVARVAGLAAMVLTALGYTVSRTMVKTAGVLLLAGLFATTQPACATVERAGGAAKHAVIECAKQDAPAIIAGVAHFGARAVIDGHIDWASIEVAAKGAGLGVGSCAVAEFLRALKKQPETQIAARSTAPDVLAQGQAVLERVSGGAEVRLP